MYKENVVVEYSGSIYVIREILDGRIRMQLAAGNSVVSGVYMYITVARFENEGGKILGIAQWMDKPLS